MIIVFDVGGSKVLGARFDNDGTITRKEKIKTPQNYQDFINEVKKLYQDLCPDEKPEKCVIALPGAIDRENGVAIAFGNLPWENVSVANDLADTITCPILLENDAKLAGLAEAQPLKELYDRILYVTVSTGIGISLIKDGAIDYSVGDAGGKAFLMEHNGRVMPWEDFASGRAIVTVTGKLASEITDDEDWREIAHNLAVGLIDLISILSPNCIIFGGGVGTHLEKYQEQLWNELEFYQGKMIKLPQIRKAEHPEEAVVYGGYIFCKKDEV